MRSSAAARRTPLAAWRHRDFRVLWIGLLVSTFGSQFTTVAMAWQIYELTSSPLQFGLLGLARGVPLLLLLLYGGVLADALVVLVGVAVHATCILLFAYSHVFWFSVLMLAGEGLGNAFSAILRNTINQLLTPDELRGRVSAVNSMFTNTGPQLGQFRAGAVAELVGPELSLFSGGLAILALVGIVGAQRAIRGFELPTMERAREQQPVAARS